MDAAEASTERAEPDTVSSEQVPTMRTVCSAPDTDWLPPSPHESASAGASPGGLVETPVWAGTGDAVTTDGDGTSAAGGGLETASPGGRRVSTGSGVRLQALSATARPITPIAPGARR